MNLPIPDKYHYTLAKPFPHAVIDGAFPADNLRYLLKYWPTKHERYATSKDENEKGSTTSENLMHSVISDFVKINFQSQEFITFLEALTGITGLVFDCRRWGLHETFQGGFLSRHQDYTISKETGLQLRVNVILYLNEVWNEEYNGHLELYEDAPEYGRIKRWPAAYIEPIFNRMVIFSMNAGAPAWHGHPMPLDTPVGVSRKSIALNYFTIPQKKAVEQGTIFQKSFLKDVLPPFIYKAITKK